MVDLKENIDDSSQCPSCKGKGFVEYDAGIVQIGCKTCEMTGKVDCELTKEEFEKAYAFRSDMTPDQVAELGLAAMPCDCGEDDCKGWAMQNASNIVELKQGGALTVLGTPRDILGLAIEDFPCPCGDSTHFLVKFSDEREAIDDSNSGIGQPDSITRSPDTGEPKQPKKPKAKRKAKAKSS